VKSVKQRALAPVADPALGVGGGGACRPLTPLPYNWRPLEGNIKPYMNNSHRDPVNIFYYKHA